MMVMGLFIHKQTRKYGLLSSVCVFPEGSPTLILKEKGS